MKILKFEEFVNERLFKSSIDRIKSGELRKEDGVKFNTCLGDTLILSNKNCPCDNLIKNLLTHVDNESYPGISFDEIDDYPVTMRNDIIDNRINCVYLLGMSGVVVSFDDYGDLVNDEEINSNEITEEDYIVIVKSITDHFKKMNILNLKPEEEKGLYVSKLMSDRHVSNINDEMGSSEWFEKMKNEFNQKFPDIELKTWRGDFDRNIGINIDYNAVIKYDDCVKWIKKYFNKLIGITLFKI